MLGILCCTLLGLVYCTTRLMGCNKCSNEMVSDVYQDWLKCRTRGSWPLKLPNVAACYFSTENELLAWQTLVETAPQLRDS